jgi:hypothetical protein
MIEPFGMEFAKFACMNRGMVLTQEFEAIETLWGPHAPGNPTSPVDRECIPREHCGIPCAHKDSSAQYQTLFYTFAEKTG